MATEVESVPSALSSEDLGASAPIGAAVLLIVGEPLSEKHKELILSEITKGFSTWDSKAAGIDINDELAQIANKADLGDEGPNGERVINLRSDSFSIEILINPQTETVKAALHNFLSESTQCRHLIYAGHGFQGSGEWILQDDTFSCADFAHCFKDADVENAMKRQNGGTLTVNCFGEGDWNSGHISKHEFAKSLQVRLNPGDKLENINGILQFAAYVSNFIKAKPVSDILKSSDIVGNIRFNRPTLYVFPGCQGDSALFGISGFNLLINGGFSKRSCFWDFTRHLDRIDACLLTHLGADNLFGISSVLEKKNLENVHPEIGFMYLNSSEKTRHSPSGSVDREIQKEPSLLINLAEEGSKIIEFSKQLGQIPHPCSRSLSGQHLDPVNLFHKVGQGSLDMYILNPVTDSKELKDFYQQWNKQVRQFGSQQQVPLPNMMSICALLVWRPASPMEKIIRILFPGNAPQHKLIEGLERMKNVDFLKHPSCCQHDLHKPVARKPPAGITRPSSARLTATKTPAVKLETSRRSEPKAPELATRPKATSTPKPKGLKEDVNKKAAKTKEKTDKPKSASSSPSKASTQSTTPSGTPKEVASPTNASPVKVTSPKKESAAPASDMFPETVAQPVVDNLIDVSPTPEPQAPPMVNHMFPEEPVSEGLLANEAPPMEPLKPESPEPLPDPDQFASETLENGIKHEQDLPTSPAAPAMDKQTLEDLGIYDEDEEVYPAGESTQAEIEQRDTEPDDEIKPQPLPEPVAYPATHFSQEPDVIPDNAYNKESTAYEDISPLDSPVDKAIPPTGFLSEPDLVPTIQEHGATEKAETSGILTPPTEEMRTPLTDEAEALNIDRSENIPTPEEINQMPADEVAEQELEQKALEHEFQQSSRELSLEPPREPSPEPQREPSPELQREPSPELQREPSPEPQREPSPEPQREPSPEPMREQTPEPVREQSPEPLREQSPEPFREQGPEPPRGHSPEPLKEQSPEPPREQSPEPLREQSPVPPRDHSPEPLKEQSPEPPREQIPEPFREQSPEPQSAEPQRDIITEPLREQSPEPHEQTPDSEVSASDDESPVERYPDVLPQQEQQMPHESPNKQETLLDMSDTGMLPSEPCTAAPFESREIPAETLEGEFDTMDQSDIQPQPEMYDSLYEPRVVDVAEKEEHEELEKNSHLEAVQQRTEHVTGELDTSGEGNKEEQLESQSGISDDLKPTTEQMLAPEVQKQNFEQPEIYDESEEEEDTEVPEPVSSTGESQVLTDSGPYVYEKDVDVSDEESIQSQERPYGEEQDAYDDEDGECQESNLQGEKLMDSEKPAPDCLGGHLVSEVAEEVDDPYQPEDVSHEQESTLPEAFEKDETPQPIECLSASHATNTIDFSSPITESAAESDKIQTEGQNEAICDKEDSDSIDGGTPDDDKDIDESFGQAQKQLSDNYGSEGQRDQKGVEALDVSPNGPATGHFDQTDQHYNPFLATNQQDPVQLTQTEAQPNQLSGLNPFANEFVPEKFGDESEQDSFDPLAEWGKPMGLPSPPPPEAKADDKVVKDEASSKPGAKAGDPKKSAGSPVKGKPGDKRPLSASLNKSSSNKPANGIPDLKTKTAPKTNTSPRKAPIPERKPAPSRATRPVSAPVRDANTSKSEARTRPSPSASSRRPATATGSRSSPFNAKAPPLPPVTAFYVNLTYIPNHGDPSYSDVEFFKRVRARYYVLSALSPNPQILNALLEAKKTWGDDELEVTIIPTYDNETLQHWMGLHKSELNDLKIEVAPSANRCTIHLQDHETSSSAYRLEF